MNKKRTAYRNITMRDVARKAGVSMGIVSMVINRKVGVRPDTRRKVLAAVRALGYVPSPIGMAINRKRSGLIGLVVPVISDAIFSGVAQGVGNDMEVNGKTVFLGHSQDGPAVEARLVRLFMHLHVDGLALAQEPSLANLPLLKRIVRGGLPIVQIERYAPGLEADYVGSDNFAAAYRVTRDLIEQGHTAIGLVTGTVDFTSRSEREQGYNQALKDAGIAPDPAWVLRVNARDFWGQKPYDFMKCDPAARHVVGSWLDAPRTPRAILWLLDAYYPFLVRDLRARNWHNGRDVHIILFDANPMLDFGGQVFVNVAQDTVRIGVESARRLLSRIHSRDAMTPPVFLRLPCQITRLQSWPSTPIGSGQTDPSESAGFACRGNFQRLEGVSGR